VPWFPTKFEDFDNIGRKVLVFGDGIEEIDHPTCNDPEYRARRKYIGEVSLTYKMSDPEIPKIKYTEDEKSAWRYCFSKQQKLFKTHVCREYNNAIE